MRYWKLRETNNLRNGEDSKTTREKADACLCFQQVLELRSKQYRPFGVDRLAVLTV